MRVNEFTLINDSNILIVVTKLYSFVVFVIRYSSLRMDAFT